MDINKFIENKNQASLSVLNEIDTISLISPDNDQNDGDDQKYICRCGYDSTSNNNITQEKCENTLALLNHITFPSLKLLGVKGSQTYLPKKHWAFLIEIIVFESTKTSFFLKGKTIFGEDVNVCFNNNKDENKPPTTFTWTDISIGMVIFFINICT